MAKGDYVKATLATPSGVVETGMTITTRGRSLKRVDTKRAGVTWVTFAETMPSGRAAGDQIMVRLDAILSLTIHKEPA